MDSVHSHRGKKAPNRGAGGNLDSGSGIFSLLSGARLCRALTQGVVAEPRATTGSLAVAVFKNRPGMCKLRLPGGVKWDR